MVSSGFALKIVLKLWELPEGMFSFLFLIFKCVNPFFSLVKKLTYLCDILLYLSSYFIILINDLSFINLYLFIKVLYIYCQFIGGNLLEKHCILLVETQFWIISSTVLFITILKFWLIPIVRNAPNFLLFFFRFPIFPNSIFKLLYISASFKFFMKFFRLCTLKCLSRSVKMCRI